MANQKVSKQSKYTEEDHLRAALLTACVELCGGDHNKGEALANKLFNRGDELIATLKERGFEKLPAKGKALK